MQQYTWPKGSYQFGNPTAAPPVPGKSDAQPAMVTNTHDTPLQRQGEVKHAETDFYTPAAFAPKEQRGQDIPLPEESSSDMPLDSVRPLPTHEEIDLPQPDFPADHDQRMETSTTEIAAGGGNIDNPSDDQFLADAAPPLPDFAVINEEDDANNDTAPSTYNDEDLLEERESVDSKNSDGSQ
ncbi:unnamed protein product [Oikopleura dioica]|uniref:Uncharacterized protein n=1 Tax=Oikopleura dioica TaxID=34765 RepID=E4XZT0_OIKDI|nr:unnamed protein product [Oikopleura dioica]